MRPGPQLYAAKVKRILLRLSVGVHGFVAAIRFDHGGDLNLVKNRFERCVTRHAFA
jgi:hypothetical protein